MENEYEINSHFLCKCHRSIHLQLHVVVGGGGGQGRGKKVLSAVGGPVREGNLYTGHCDKNYYH